MEDDLAFYNPRFGCVQYWFFFAVSRMKWGVGKVSTETVDNSVHKAVKCRIIVGAEVHWSIFSHFLVILKTQYNQWLTVISSSVSLFDALLALIFQHSHGREQAVDSISL